MLDKGDVGQEYWRRVQEEKETARKLNELSFKYNLYHGY
jgi:hypothetical protein